MRKILVISLLGMLFLYAFPIFALHNYAQSYTVDSWPTVQNDLANTGYSVFTGPKTNKILWNYTASSYVWSDIAVSEGKVYFGSLDGIIYALNAETGALAWNFTTGKDELSSDPILNGVFSSASIANGIVYIGSNDNNVYALNSTTGVLIWNYTTDGPVQSNPKIFNGIVYIGSNDNNVYALNAATGTKIWNYTTGDDVISVPAVVDGIVYMGSYDYNVYAFNSSTGAMLWKFPTGGGVESSPTVANGIVYFGSYDNNTYALDAATGTQIWNYTTGSDRCVQASPAVADGIVYVGSSYVGALDGNISALDAATGTQIWNYTTDGLVVSAPAVAGGIVYVGSAYIGPLTEEYSEVILTGIRGNVYALDAETGELVWNYTTGGAVYSSPAIVDGVLYVGSMDRNVYAFGSVSTTGSGTPITAYYIIAAVVVSIIVGIAIFLMIGRREKKG